LCLIILTIYVTNSFTRYHEPIILRHVSEMKKDALNKALNTAMSDPKTKDEIESIITDSVLSDNEVERLKSILITNVFIVNGDGPRFAGSVFDDPIGRPYVFTLSREKGGGIIAR
jgi:hypothetical protein